MAAVLPWLLLAAVAFAASTLAAVTGVGGAVVLLPFVVAVYGIWDAVPVLTGAQLLGNAGGCGRTGGRCRSRWSAGADLLRPRRTFHPRNARRPAAARGRHGLVFLVRGV